jgi:hypothetical protein
VIRQEGNKWILYSRDGKKKLGEHGSREEALVQERAILAAQARRLGKEAEALAEAVKAKCKTHGVKKPKKK